MKNTTKYTIRNAPLVSLLLLLCILTLAGCDLVQTEPEETGSGTLHLYGIDPITLDPGLSGEMTSHEYIAQIFGGLVRLDDELEIVPDIAERWDISDDSRTYTFHLREDVEFHDGRQVKADDFKYSWERACNPATGSLVAPLYLGDISGADDVLAGNASEISGVTVVNDYELRVQLDAPLSYFLYKMTYPTAFVVDRYNVADGGSWWRNPNGTGPFKLAEWDQGNRLVLERNDRYYGDKARLEMVEFQLWGGVPMRLYENGEIDVAGVSVSYIDLVTDPSGPFADQLRIYPELSFSYIGFNTTEPPFDDVNVRRAFSHAIDKDKIVSLVFRDLVEKADGILPPGIPGYDASLEGLEFDVDRAKELIALSVYGDAADLPPITLTTTGYGGEISQSLSAIITQWRENLGVEVEVRMLEPERYLYHLTGEKNEIFDMGWIADYPHPQDFLEILFRTGNESNYGEYSNPAVDARLAEAAVEMDPVRSLEMYREIEWLLVEDAACLPLWFEENYILVKPYVAGYELNPMGYALLNKVSIIEP
ncbi:MAG: peptide ABC transporter substrate-binding protein [Dehalococcoidia bacterium]|jgi:oligopeptide transport system substrate-binding protein